MCVILFATRAHPQYPLIVAANRDEAYTRPAAPAAFWTDHPRVFGGRDLDKGGTWLGIALSGRFAAITNYRQRPRATEAPRSRGEITRNYLTDSSDAVEYLRTLDAHRNEYRGYSVIVGTLAQLYFHSNRSEAMQPIAPGVHGLSNRLLDEPWPKVQQGIAVLTGLLRAGERELTENLFGLLADRTQAPDHLLPDTGIGIDRERDVSPPFITGASYGTRASTVMLVAVDGSVFFCERTFGPHGVPTGTTEQRFQLEHEVTRGQAAQAAGA
jgi:uncharacterized protein with NRDE domain